VKSAKSIMRRRASWLQLGTLALTVTLASIGLAVDRFDQVIHGKSHLMYVMDTDSGAAP
jgi:hypothetical protein